MLTEPNSSALSVLSLDLMLRLEPEPIWGYSLQCFFIDISVQVEAQYCEPKAALKATVYRCHNVRALIIGAVGQADVLVWHRNYAWGKWDGITLVNLTPVFSTLFPTYFFISCLNSWSTATVLCFYFAIHNFLFVSISHLWCWTLSKFCLKNLTSMCYAASVMFFLSATAALSSKISSRLVKHDLLCLIVCYPQSNCLSRCSHVTSLEVFLWQMVILPLCNFLIWFLTSFGGRGRKPECHFEFKNFYQI